MKKSDEIKSLIEKYRQQLQNKYHIKSIGLFGSVARGDHSADSDIDILVEFEQPIGLDFVTLGDELEEILGQKVDLVSLNSIKPRIFEYIKKDLVYV